jgi:hypothetical protein
MTPAQQQLYTEWQQNEFSIQQSLTGLNLPDCAPLRVVKTLQYRKIYLLTQMQLTVNTADNYCVGNVLLKKNKRVVSTLPASSGKDTANALLTASKSLVTLFTSWDASLHEAQKDSILVTLSAKFTGGDATGQPDKMLLLPAYVQSDCDEITFQMLGCGANGAATAGFRVFLGCLSSAVPFS